MAWWGRSTQLATIEKLIRQVVKNQGETIMILEDVKKAADDLHADAISMHDEVMVAIDHITKSVSLDDNPDLKAHLESLKASHAAFVDNLKALKDKVDSVVASGGPAA